ncbi:MAG TPA: ribonuclease Z [Cryomorphaceae bacterium]|nr:ribonuclease Z [Owenweeksia sp.]HAD96190.1 ribonuclease Z [Cryomorphaceae bacterium]HBF18586.1 ribonuclease Z [Cryomorphaceae bacterium]HCQ15849.1 ribonuclease Z [Cryomorphaceae bacterium]|tara:strand:- start:166 stop:1116 length:951 start_codon:yes stop_codon:yes gene_type:complete
MDRLELTILGASSAIPLANRNPTSQFLTLASHHFLIDCGEGTQVRLRENNIGFSRIDKIFISHLHGDHFFGLAPLLSTLHLLDRQKEIHIYSPKGLKEVIHAQMKLQGSWLKYPVIFHNLNPNEEEVIFEDERVSVKAFPLRHSIPCFGFWFREKERPRKMLKSAIEQYSIPVTEIRQIKKGSDWVDEQGNLIPNRDLTESPAASLSYAYCTDTSPLEHLNQFIDSPDLLYHEATFMEEHAERAAQTYHSTARQAASVAKSVNARQLMVGHFSIRYNDLNPLLDEAKEVFPNTILAKDGQTYALRSSHEELVPLAR